MLHEFIPHVNSSFGGYGWVRTTDHSRMKAVLYQLSYITVAGQEELESPTDAFGAHYSTN